MQQSSVSMLDGLLMSSALNSQVKKQTLLSKIPDYVGTPLFTEFLKKVDASLNDNVGYMFCVLNKEQYRPGELIEGRIFLDCFIPSFQNKLMIKLEAAELFPQKHFDLVFQHVKEQSVVSEETHRNI